VRLNATAFEGLAGWREVDAGPALQALVRSCRRWDAKPDSDLLNPNAPYAGRVADWRGACLEAAMLAPLNPDSDAARAFFERNFKPMTLRGSGQLTGYYEPNVEVRAYPDSEFSMAIRARPDDLLTGDLGQFIAGLQGRRIVGRAADQTFEPYRSRADIEAMDLGIPLAWGRPIDVFFLQIQGSGRLIYPAGEQARVRFAAHNGLTYVSIGRILIQRGELEPHNASKQAIEDWLNLHGPSAWQPLFDENPRYVFFSLDALDDPDEGPLGAQGAPLTPLASLAVDPRHHAWGVPILVSADLPDAPGWRGLVIAQDAGGAIQGPVRGDLFYGWGDAAGQRAGRQNDPDARWTILLPRALAERAN
jgi:membrane-bound lytic murein transglycosylase A